MGVEFYAVDTGRRRVVEIGKCAELRAALRDLPRPSPVTVEHIAILARHLRDRGPLAQVALTAISRGDWQWFDDSRDGLPWTHGAPGARAVRSGWRFSSVYADGCSWERDGHESRQRHRFPVRPRGARTRARSCRP